MVVTAPWASDRKAHRRPLDDDATLRAPVKLRCRCERSRGEDDIPVSTWPPREGESTRDNVGEVVARLLDVQLRRRHRRRTAALAAAPAEAGADAVVHTCSRGCRRWRRCCPASSGGRRW
jgi:hypothetical protein